MKKTTLSLAMLFFILSAFAGDILTLNDNLIYEGKVTKIKNCSVIFKIDKEKFEIPATEIYSIQFENIADKVYTKYLEMDNASGDNCLKGRLDADNLHGKKGGHFALGVLFGPFAMIGTALANPTPDRGARTLMLSKNKDLMSDMEYISCYKKKAKGQLIGMEALGWGTWILLLLVASGA